MGSGTNARSSMNKGIWTAGSNDLDIQLACTGGARCINLAAKMHQLGVQEASTWSAKRIYLECKNIALRQQKGSPTPALPTGGGGTCRDKGKPHPSPPQRGRGHLPGQGKGPMQTDMARARLQIRGVFLVFFDFRNFFNIIYARNFRHSLKIVVLLH